MFWVPYLHAEVATPKSRNPRLRRVAGIPEKRNHLNPIVTITSINHVPIKKHPITDMCGQNSEVLWLLLALSELIQIF